MKAKFARHSVCKCGFPILDDGIQLGTIYDIDPHHKVPITIRCGGCKKENRMAGVWVEARGNSRAGYLPESIFEPVAEVETNQNKRTTRKEK